MEQSSGKSPEDGRVPPSGSRPAARDLAKIRERLVDRTIFALVFFGTPAVAASSFRAFQLGWQGALVSHFATWLCFILLYAFRRKIPYGVKAFFVLAAGFLAGLSGLFTFGLVGGALLAFTAVITLATVFFGLRPGAAAALATLLAAAIIGILIMSGRIAFSYDISAYALSRSAWFTTLAAYGVLATIIVGSLAMLHSFLKQNIEDLKSRADSQDSANSALRAEMEKKEEAREALRASESKYRGILESIGEGTYEVDLSGRMRFFNRALLDIYGYEEAEFLGMDYRKHIVSEDTVRAYDEFNSVFRSGEPLRQTRYGIRHKRGEKRYLEASIFPVKDPEGKVAGFRGVVRDITARMEMERQQALLVKQIQEGQKWKAIGTLAGGVAHDFNNLLMGIQGNTSLLLLFKAKDDPEREKLVNIEACVRDATKLTSQLLAYARGGRYEIKATDINRLVEKTCLLFGRTRKEIRLALDLQSTGVADVDRGQMQQVLLNLLVNAWQAMPSGGEIFISTADEALADASRLPEGGRNGNYIRISVRDTGKGMDEETLQRAFEPFFTTKDKTRGTGLGLSSAYGIVVHHGGFINLASRPGQGCTVDIFLPAGKDAPEPDDEPEGPAPVGGTGSILVVDDEAVVLEPAREMLESQGYRVLTAGNGQKALDLASDPQNRIDLVILDMVMPGMGGEEVFRRIREIRPGLKVLLSSGYSMEAKASALFEKGLSGFLQKPYSIGELSRSVQEALDK